MGGKVKVIRLEEKLALFSDHWNPRIVAELNDNYVKLAKIEGEFVWHRHDHEDEMFLVVRGRLKILLRDGSLDLSTGDMCVIPRGVEHLPVADEETHILMVEPKSTRNTGEVEDERTRDRLDWI